MPSDKETLISMGFDPARVEWALKSTSNRGLQPAMDHILEHDGQPVPEDLNAVPVAGSTDVTMDGDDDDDADALRNLQEGAAEAKSIKCSECGKVFKNTALANYHAEKSGHDQFEESTEEIKPLTDEEKKARLAELRQKMAEKRAQKELEESKEQKAAETLRRKAGKDTSKLKEEMQLKQALKDAEQKRRDKIEDAKAKNAIRAQIEADKRARAEKAAREKALREGKPDPAISAAGEPTSPSGSSPVTAAAGSSSGVAGRDFKDTRLQIRMASGGQPYTTTLSSDATLREVAEFLAGQVLSIDVETVTFAQHFPRKVFSRSDFSSTLRELGLTPSAVLIAS